MNINRVIEHNPRMAKDRGLEIKHWLGEEGRRTGRARGRFFNDCGVKSTPRVPPRDLQGDPLGY